MTQNGLAAAVREQGLHPRSPKPREPQYDLGWEVGSRTFVAEVKSLTLANEERQLRLGLGQVLRYRHVLSGSGDDVQAVLAVERERTDESWARLCESLDVYLTWPPFDGL